MTMMTPMILPVRILAEAAPTADLIPSLLTGGGFVFMAAVMGGLFLWNKNKADSAKSIAEGSVILVKGTREELQECRTGLNELRRATESLIDAVVTIMARAHPANGHEVVITVTRTEVIAVNAALSEARTHLN